MDLLHLLESVCCHVQPLMYCVDVLCSFHGQQTNCFVFEVPNETDENWD